MPASLAFLVDRFEQNGNQIAIESRRGLRRDSVTYRELATLTRRFAAELIARNITEGDRVLLWGDNSAEWIAAFFGCVVRGVLPVPLDNASTPEFAQRVEREVSPKLIVAGIANTAPFHPATPCLNLAQLSQTITTQQAAALATLSESHPLQIIFTSGTTGDPKGVVHTHQNVLASLLPIESEIHKYLKYERLVHPLRFLHTLPLSHVFGQFLGLWIPAVLAAEIHFESRLVASELVTLIRQRRISIVAAVPRVLDLLRTALITSDPGLPRRVEAARSAKAWQRWWIFRHIHRQFGWKFWGFICGGAALPLASEEFWNGLGFVVIQGYGMTETTALISLNHPFRSSRGSVGEILPGREVRLAEDGEVLVRGDTISTATWQGGAIHRQETPWLATGDLASFDENGSLRFKGRKKDVIVTASGLNIYPQDLEAALLRQPAVKAAAILETASATGPQATPVLLLHPGSDPAAAIAAANSTLAPFQHMQHWVLWPEPDFPRTSTGKILRREIARRIEQGLPTHTHSAAPELNLDSLGRVELQAKLEEQYGIALDDAAVQQLQTQQDLDTILAATPSKPAGPRHIYPKWPWNPFVQAIRTIFLELIALPLLRFLATPKLRGPSPHALPREPMLIVANHVTSYDVPFVLAALPRRIRTRTAVAMSAEMILDWRRARNQGHWFLNLIAPIEYVLVTGLFNVFPLPQQSGFRQSFAHAGEAVHHGYSVIVFPEGHRSPDGRPQPFKPGAGLLWGDLGVAALPVHLDGLGALKTTGARWFRSRRITVSVGDPLPAPASHSPMEATRILEAAVFEFPQSSR